MKIMKVSHKKCQRFYRRLFFFEVVCGGGAIISAFFNPVLAITLGCLCFIGWCLGQWEDGMIKGKERRKDEESN